MTETEVLRSPEIRDGDVQYWSNSTVFADHVPLSQVSVDPTRKLPVIDAGSIFVGAAWLYSFAAFVTRTIPFEMFLR